MRKFSRINMVVMKVIMAITDTMEVMEAEVDMADIIKEVTTGEDMDSMAHTTLTLMS